MQHACAHILRDYRQTNVFYVGSLFSVITSAFMAHLSLKVLGKQSWLAMRRRTSSGGQQDLPDDAEKEKKSGTSGPESCRKERRKSVSKNLLASMEERCRMSTAEAETARSNATCLQAECALLRRKLSWHENVRDYISTETKDALLREPTLPAWIIVEGHSLAS